MLAVGSGDLLADPKDVGLLEEQLKEGKQNQIRKEYGFGHLGFFMDETVEQCISDTFDFIDQD